MIMDPATRKSTVELCYIPLLKDRDNLKRSEEAEHFPQLLSMLCKYFMRAPFYDLTLAMSPFSSSNVLFLFKRIDDPAFISQQCASRFIRASWY